MFHLTLNVFLYYLVKLAADFIGVFACETWEFILPDVWSSNSPGLNPNDRRSEKQCSSDEQKIRDVNELK